MEQEERVEVRRRSKNWTWIENAVLDDERLTKEDVLVYLVLARHSDNDNGTSYPSLTLIGKEARTSRQGVVNSLNNLAKHEYLLKERRIKPDGGFTSNIYTLTGGVVNNRHGGSQPQILGGSQPQVQELDPPSELDSTNDVVAVDKKPLPDEKGTIRKLYSPKYGVVVYENTAGYDDDKLMIAIACLDSARGPIKNPSGYIDMAVRGGWRPPDKVEPIDEALERANKWYNESTELCANLEETGKRVVEQRKTFRLEDHNGVKELHMKLGIKAAMIA